MNELHNKLAIWELTISVTDTTTTTNLEGTYFQAIQTSAAKNKNKVIELTTAKALMKKYTNAFKENNKNTAKSKALSEKITELKGLNQDEVLVQLTANSYQTLEQFYTSTLFKSLEGTVKELNQVTLLNQIKGEIAAQSASALTKDDVIEIVLADRKNRKSDVVGTTIGTAIVKAGCIGVLAFAAFYQACMIQYSTTVGYLNESPITQEKDYKLCMAEKNDVGNCLQYTNIIKINKYSPLGDTRAAEAKTIINKNELLSLATDEFNPKIYKDIETCSAKNLPDIRDSFQSLIGVPTLLTICQSNEISNIKGVTAKGIDTIQNRQLIEPLSDEQKENGEKAGKLLLAMIIIGMCALPLFMAYLLNEDGESKKRKP